MTGPQARRKPDTPGIFLGYGTDSGQAGMTNMMCFMKAKMLLILNLQTCQLAN